MKERNLVVEAIVWSVETHNLSFSLFILTCKGSLPLALVSLQAPGFCYTTDKGLSLGLLLLSLLLSHFMDVLLFWIRGFMSFTCFNSS